MTPTPTLYPEHDKLAKVKDDSQAIGEFLDFGLPRLGGGMTIYEELTVDCECGACSLGRGDRSRFHTDEEIATAVDGVVKVKRMFPTMRTIPSMLAEYFSIDEQAIETEKRAMLQALRA